VLQLFTELFLLFCIDLLEKTKKQSETIKKKIKKNKEEEGGEGDRYTYHRVLLRKQVDWIFFGSLRREWVVHPSEIS
jgi:hypothetical protein